MWGTRACHSIQRQQIAFHGTVTYLGGHSTSSNHWGKKKDPKQHLLNLSVQFGTKHKFPSFCCKDLYVYLYIVVSCYVYLELNNYVHSPSQQIMSGKVVQIVFRHTWRFIYTWFCCVMTFVVSKCIEYGHKARAY
jgi:hypothetical protein